VGGGEGRAETVGSHKLFLEFGVNKGYSARHFTEILSEYQIKLIGFDSFNGLVDSGFGSYYTKGSASMEGEIVQNVKNNKDLLLEVGLIKDTLPNFLKKNSSKKIIFCHIDVDTYETTKFILSAIKPLLLKGSIILFDEIHNFAGWEQGEYKALIETFRASEYSFIYFSQNNYQASISIL
jgi:predicted O-methyltransferase YrrM